MGKQQAAITKDAAMDSRIDWEEAFERAGLWPVAVELPLGEVAYLLWYQTRNDFSRVVTSGGRVVVLSDLATVATFVRDSEGFGEGDPGWEATRRLAGIVGGETPDEKAIPRRLVGQSLEWLQKIPLFASADQTEELLNCMDFLSEWHRTLYELGLVGRWPAVLYGAANVLAESVIWGTTPPAAAFERVFFLGVWPVMERVVSDLMRHTMLVSYPSAA
jgi:hypothetical protein